MATAWCQNTKRGSFERATARHDISVILTFDKDARRRTPFLKIAHAELRFAVMKAIEVTKTGGPEVLTLADLPRPTPKANEALLEIKAIGINFIDVYIREGRYPSPLPFIAGQEAAGVVTEVGSDVTNVKAGDRV